MGSARSKQQARGNSTTGCASAPSPSSPPGASSSPHAINESKVSPDRADGKQSDLPDRYYKRTRRTSISAETVDPSNYRRVVHTKEEATKRRLRNLLPGSNKVLFNELSATRLEDIVDAMFSVSVETGETLINQGDDGDNFYVVDEGSFDIFVKRDQNEQPLKVMTAVPGTSFGELALMYMCPRAATVIATEKSSCWALSRSSFQQLVVAGEAKRHAQYEEFLSTIPVLSSLNKFERLRLSDALTPISFPAGSNVIAQGTVGDSQMYILEEGTAAAFLNDRVKVLDYSRGSYFGELALIADQPRKATVQAVTDCQCLQLSRDDFTNLLGPVKDILLRNADLYVKYEDAFNQDQ